LRYLPTKNSPVQTVSHTNNRTTQSGAHGFAKAKRPLLTKVMVLLRPNAMGRLKVHNNNYLLRNNNIQSLSSWRDCVCFETTRILKELSFFPQILGGNSWLDNSLLSTHSQLSRPLLSRHYIFMERWPTKPNKSGHNRYHDHRMDTSYVDVK
jgi:hypothetical protein